MKNTKKISIRDLKFIKEFRFNKRSFDWTIYALFRLNLIAIVTAFVFEIQEGFQLEEFLTGSLYLIGIATIVSVTLIPCVDVYNFLLDKKVCRLMGWDYDEYYVLQYSTQQAEKLRDNYSKMAEEDKDFDSMKNSIEELGREFSPLPSD